MEDATKKVLITGIAGGQGRLLTRRLHSEFRPDFRPDFRPEFKVCGVDLTAWDDAPAGVSVHRVDLRKRKFEEVIRTERPHAIVHNGYIRHFLSGVTARHDVNVRGTMQLLDHCVACGVKQLIVLSSGYVYGAAAENPYFMDEDAPLSASRKYPEIRDLVEVDTLATTFLWKHPEIRTCVLRPVSILGPTVQSMVGAYVRQSRVWTVMGFNPMMQFIHESDFTEAIVLALTSGLRGVYNVVGPGEVPVHVAIEECGATPRPIPEPILRPSFERLFEWGMWPFPAGLLDYLKYPVSLCGDRFDDETGFRAQVPLPAIFGSLKEASA